MATEHHVTLMDSTKWATFTGRGAKSPSTLILLTFVCFTLQVVIRGEDSFAFEDVDNPEYQEELPESRNVDRPKTVKRFFISYFLPLESDAACSHAFPLHLSCIIRICRPLYMCTYCLLPAKLGPHHTSFLFYFTPLCLHAEFALSLNHDSNKSLSVWVKIDMIWMGG